jgi:hypothetical protein
MAGRFFLATEWQFIQMFTEGTEANLDLVTEV